MRLDCLTVRCVRSEDQPRTRVSTPPSHLSAETSLHPLLRSEQLPAGVGGTARGVEARARLRAPSGALALRLAAGRPRWWIGFALTDLPSLPFSAGAIMYGPVLYRPGARSRAFHDLSAFLLSREGACTCRGSRAVDSIRHDAWSSWIAGGFMKSSALGRARAAATCADDGPLSLGLLSWLCVACGAARGTREGLAARRMRDRLALPCWQSPSTRPAARG